MEKTALFSPALDTKYVNPKLWGKIQQLDLSLIVDRLILKYRWSKKKIEKAISAYRQFLYMTQVFEMPLSPTQDVDVIWHDHILHTKKYADDCQKTFGAFIHHYPIPMNLIKGQVCGVDGDGNDNGNDDYCTPSKKPIKSFCGLEGDGEEHEEKPVKKPKPKQKPVVAPKPKPKKAKPKSAQFTNFAEVQSLFFVLN